MIYEIILVFGGRLMNLNEAHALIKEQAAAGFPFYCYVLRRERKKPFYVGIGKGRRIREHSWELTAYDKGTHPEPERANTYKLAIMRQLGGRVDYDILGFFKTWQEAAELEVETIEFVGRVARGGPLTNMTDGGEGCPGRPSSDKQKQAASNANSKPKNPESIRKMVETKLAMGPWVKSFLGKTHTEEWRRKMSEKMSGENSPFFGKRGEACHNFGKRRTPEQKELIAIRAKEGRDKASQDPEKFAIYMANKIYGCNKKNPLESLLSFLDSLRKGNPKTSSEKLKQYLQDEEYKLSFIKTFEEFISSLKQEE